MNLIEQLGGYEEAKEVLELVKARDHKYSQNFERPVLEKALLQYRREHNIFEVEDKVVFIDDFMHDEIMIASNVNDAEIHMDGDSKRAILGMVRHATDAEIEAGKRLEVGDEN